MYYSAWDEVRRAQKRRAERVGRIEDALGEFYEEFEQFKDDTDARLEELEIETGFLDGDSESQSDGAEDAVRRGVRKSVEGERARYPYGGLTDTTKYDDYRPYEDPTPSFIGEGDADEDWLAARTDADTARTEDGAYLEKSGEIRNAELYFAEDGEFYLTTPTIRESVPHFSGVWVDPTTLRALAGIIESIQETDNKRREP